MPSALVAIAVRTAVCVAVFLVFAHLVELPGDDGLGTGLLAFATFVVIAGVWGGYDGWRRPLGVVALVWVAVGALTSLAMEVALRLDGEVGTDPGELVGWVVFMVVLIGVPAIAAGALAAVVRRLSAQPAR